MKTLITGVSTRAIAESAVRSGNNVFTIDYFGDSDQKRIVENYSLLRDFNLPFRAENLVRACSRFDFDSVVYISNFENFPELLENLPERVKILGNTPDTLRKVRDWRLLRDFMKRNNIPFPVTLLPGEDNKARGQKEWLLKPTNSGGGSRIKTWEGERLSKNQILQKHVEGIPASASFLANGRESVLMGLTAQLIGIKELGANGCTWCGNILPLPLDRDAYLYIIDQIENYITMFTSHFGLKGACGIDFIIKLDDKEGPAPFILEINPRYTASMEIIEAVYGLNIYSLHLMAVDGRLPDFSLAQQTVSEFYGKGIVFAGNKVKIGNTGDWEERGIKDIPFPGDEIEQGHPVCTVMGIDNSFDKCKSKLFASTKEIRLETGDMD